MRPSLTTGYGSSSRTRNGAIFETRCRICRSNISRLSLVMSSLSRIWYERKRAAKSSLVQSESSGTPPVPAYCV